MNRFLLLVVIIFSFITASFGTSGKIKAYFNHPVATSFSHGTNAVYLNGSIGDTLIAYINRANQTLDIAIYEISQTSGMADIVGAINAAHNRGVVIRIIYDGKDNASTSISSINSAIPRLASPSTSAYNIMHNKFMIIDAADAASATVWSGSFNWTQLMFTGDYNNAIIIQDQPLAQAYVAEFNQMWGSSTATPNSTTSKFGPYKTATTAHTFTVDGHQVDLYFSPSDGTNTQIYNTINTADKELFFGVYTFTESNDATAISTKYSTSGITVKGIMDHYSVGYAAATTLTPVMGSNLKIFSGSGTVYHNKMMIVDPDYPALDPLVLTGSHNWSATADTKNDENTLIIHDSTTANIYLQSFAQNFIDMGGSIAPVQLSTDFSTLSQGISIGIYPNPVQDDLTIEIDDLSGPAAVELTDLSGHLLYLGDLVNGHNDIRLASFAAGIYLVKVLTNSGNTMSRIVKL